MSHRVRLLVAVLGLGPFACVHPPPALSAPEEDLTQTFTRITEEVSEAIRTGDRAALARHLAPGMVLINRDGRAYSRAEFLDELVPPREGYDLRFQIREPTVLGSGETRQFLHLLDEHLVIFGHDVSTVYRNTLLFRRIDGEWQIASYAYWEVPTTPRSVRLSAARLDRLVGRYELAPGKWVTDIRREGDQLVYQRVGGKPKELMPMAGNRFFLPEVEGEYFFEEDASGQAVALVFRRNWIDLRLQRLEPQPP